jgi:Tol biopolymer transport system component
LAVLAITAAGATAQGSASAEITSTDDERIVVVGLDSRREGALVWRGHASALAAARFVGRSSAVAVSMDGTSIAYARPAGRMLEIRGTPTGGGTSRLLGRTSASTTSLAFSPDGHWLAFATPTGIRLVATVGPPRGRDLRLPAMCGNSRFTALAFSPDGSRLAFSRTWGDGRAGTLGNELDVIGVDGKRPILLARNSDPYGAQLRPSWAPDGTRIALLIGDRQLYTVDANGGRIEQVTDPPPRSGDGDGVYSPDGEWLAFPRTPQRGVSDVYVVRADGSGLRRVTTTPIPGRGVPRVGSFPLVWSPDGTRLLAFRHDRFAVIDVATRMSADLRNVGVQFTIGPARWISSGTRATA